MRVSECMYICTMEGDRHGDKETRTGKVHFEELGRILRQAVAVDSFVDEVVEELDADMLGCIRLRDLGGERGRHTRGRGVRQNKTPWRARHHPGDTCRGGQ